MNQDKVESKRIDHALQNSEAKYRAIVEAFDGLVYVCSQDYRIEFVNERFIERTGHDPHGDLCYKALHDRESVCPWCVNDRVFMGETVRWEIQSPKDNRWYYIVNTPIYMADGRLYKQAMILDITDRKRIEKLLKAQNDILEMVATGRPLQETLAATAEIIDEMLSINCCSVLLLDDESRTLHHLFHTNLADDYISAVDGLEIGPCAGSCGTAAHLGEAVIVEDILSDPLWINYRHLAQDHNLRASWSLPIWSSTNKVLGTIALYDHYPRRPTPEELKMLESAAHLLGIAIERNRAERMILESEEKYRSLFEQSKDAIYMSSVDGRFIDVNQAALNLFGYSREEMLNDITVSETYVELPVREKFIQQIAEKGSVRDFELKLKKKDGSEMDCLLTSSVKRSKDGEIIGYQGIIRDVTERLLMEEALQKSAEKIKLFAYSVSHDLKSPAVGLYGLTRLLHNQYRDLLDDRGKSYCEQILKVAEQIAVLVQKINLFVSSKEAPLEIEMVKIREIMNVIKDEFSAQLNIRQVKWVEPQELPEILADRIALLRVFRNLIDNALKYGGEQLSEIEIGFEPMEKFHIFSVSDDGVGIKGGESDKLFNLFERDGAKKDIEGTGLGLAIVKEIAEQHSGSVWVEPRPERGTIFYISIAKNLSP